MTANEEHEYVLGTGSDELERLGLQNRLWTDASHSLWKQARIEPGQRVLDVGCGPGYAAFDLSQLVQSTGRVVGVDESTGFVSHVNTQAKARGLPQLSALVGDVQELEEVLRGQPPFDLAYARWVLCFVPHPEKVVAGVASALRPGGRFVVQDYFNYAAMTTAPRRAIFTKIVEATVRSWRARGGDPDVVARLPRMLRDAGLRIEHLAQQQRVARRGESMLHWGDSWWRNYVPKLVQMGEIGADDQRRFFAEWDSMQADTDFFVMPTVYEIVAVKAG